nr:MAG TPA: hypothetical protein [Caudoviricetes sp.]
MTRKPSKSTSKNTTKSDRTFEKLCEKWILHKNYKNT